MAPNPTTRKRLALNEARARQLNSSRSEHWIDDSEPATFWCECADPGCSALIQLTVSEWQRLRSDPLQFVVQPGHVQEDLDEVVARTERYAIVAKREDPEREIAERTTPSA